MKREELLSRARRELWAAWALSSEEIGSQAADTLFGLGMLVAPGEAAELVRLRTRVAVLEVQVESPELCADCGHLEDAHSKLGDTDCTASGARLLKCSCSYFIPRYGAAELMVAPVVVSLEDPHDSPLHHRYQMGRDLPPIGGVL
ncbi:hypothetical protein ACWET9_24860 [Streptomyces sp. NPDC004059]